MQLGCGRECGYVEETIAGWLEGLYDNFGVAIFGSISMISGSDLGRSGHQEQTCMVPGPGGAGSAIVCRCNWLVVITHMFRCITNASLVQNEHP